jgi:hypothetical protein
MGLQQPLPLIDPGRGRLGISRDCALGEDLDARRAEISNVGHRVLERHDRVHIPGKAVQRDPVAETGVRICAGREQRELPAGVEPQREHERRDVRRAQVDRHGDVVDARGQAALQGHRERGGLGEIPVNAGRTPEVVQGKGAIAQGPPGRLARGSEPVQARPEILTATQVALAFTVSEDRNA